MTRRQFLIAITATMTLPLFGALPRAHAQSTQAEFLPAPFVDWVERFYRAQLAARLVREGRAGTDNQQGADPLLSFPLRDYLTDAMRARFDTALTKPLPADTPEGPILDFIFGWGALPNREIKLIAFREAPWWQGLVTKKLATGNLVLVTLSINGYERELTLQGEYVPEIFTWRIADIDYGEGSLREWLAKRGG